ncbi:hypothetical protein C8Q78DRAFT_970640 [Trametes maxima]|nr:hypothetical protein C8Q78DRAFT_970640 [Trametes maxima]
MPEEANPPLQPENEPEPLQPPQQQPPRAQLDEARNPYRAECPNYNGLEWDDWRQHLVESGVVPNTEEAVAHLVARWQEKIEAEKEAWVQRGGAIPPQGRREEDQVRHNLVAQPSRNSRASSPTISERALGRAQTNARPHAKPSPIPFGKAGPQSISEPPAQYALNKLEKLEYIELSYFTAAARENARRDQLSVNEDALALERNSNSLALTSVVQPSKDARRDDQLTWDEVLEARIEFLNWAEKLGWPADWLAMHADFFYKLDSHERRSRKGGSEILVRYQAKYRREFHSQVKQGRIFDLSTLVEEALSTIENDIMRERMEASLQLVR